ncbi:DNA repair protein RecN [Harryflintia acetispora]|uniref:DNA repair protein RecN n=1 Tax=Harryflintia acetispora TaxID=1849041 RepID=A0A9X8UHC6_9FIRM|nr:DNA repair protein RecN [Harryflintia acetispora]TCL40837.1 DNA replication and repair protein RecN [Harryflintia acetispora]
MLRNLYIENLAVISRAEIELCEGFNVFTGETGAGKTILMGAIGAVLGSRTSRDLIRSGEQRAVVTALFDSLSPQTLAVLDEFGYAPEEDGTLLVSRTIRPDSTDCRVGGRPATVTVLKALAATLVDLHGQHDNTRLLSPEYHLSLIDRFGALGGQLADYQESYRALGKIKEELDALEMDEGEKARRIDLLEYQIGEIEKAAPVSGEEEELSERREVLRNAEKIAASLGAARELISPEYAEGPGLQEQLGALLEELGAAGRYLPGLQEPAERLQEVYYELQELHGELGSELEAVEFSPRALDELEARLDLLHGLKVKYGGSVEEVLAFCARAQEELDSIVRSDERRAALSQSYTKALARAQKLAKELSQARAAAGKAFVVAVEEQLRFLDMPSVRLTVSQEERPLGPMGADSIELLISPNPGEPPKPVQKIASGGEISRIMLSIKNTLSAGEEGVTSIFDEVDAGVSGRAADKIGLKLAAVAKGRQVLCVTHLAQVAAYADRHLLIRKETEDGRTFTKVALLEGEAQAGELARIISGDAVTGAARQNAQEMLCAAREKKAEN